MPKYKKSCRYRRGRHTRHTRRRHTQKKQIHMKMKMKGGTKVVVKKDKEWRIISKNEDIAKNLLENITSISEISSGSSCSMILKGDLDPKGNIKIQSQVYHADGNPTNPTDRANRPRKINIGLQFHNVCMKITLIKNGSTEISSIPSTEISSIPWKISETKTINKEVLSIEECEKEFEVQRLMYQQLLCGEIANEIIADGIATIKLSPEEFKTFYSPFYSPTQSKPPQSEPPQSNPVNKILNWVYTSAHAHNLDIHIAFMDNLEMYVPSSKIDRDTHRNKYQDIGIALVLIVLMTTGIPYDFHEGNVLIHRFDKKIKCVDFGRMHFLSNPDIETVLTKYLKICLEMNIGKHFLQFFNVSKKDDIVPKFVSQLKQIIKYSDEKYTFYSLDITEQRKRVYEILVFVAFVDIITNLSLYSPRGYFQSLWLIKNIFLFNAKELMTTESVLKAFCITYDDFLLIDTAEQTAQQVKEFINFIDNTFNPVLTYMSNKLKQSIVMCKNPKRQTSTSFREGPDSDTD